MKGYFNRSKEHELNARGIKTANHKLVASGEEDDSRNDQLMHELQNIKISLTEEIDQIIKAKPRYLTDAERKILHDLFGINITGSGVIICNEDEDILLLSDSANKNWRYYAGFEYIKDNPPTQIGDFYFYHRDDSDRVADVLDALHQIER